MRQQVSKTPTIGTVKPSTKGTTKPFNNKGRQHTLQQESRQQRDKHPQEGQQGEKYPQEPKKKDKYPQELEHS
jgi:hypothetical protein